jgi:hypothetical protein
MHTSSIDAGGHIAEAGSFADLMSAGLGFASMMKETQVGGLS